jgi:DNA-binding IclR family transcriptional regulator
MRRPADYSPLIDTLRAARSPVSGVVLADLSGLPRRTTQRWLTTLERSGVVERRGVKGGWRLRGFEYSNVAHPGIRLC